MEDIKLSEFCAVHSLDRRKVDYLVKKLGLHKKRDGTNIVVSKSDALVLLKELELPEELESLTYWAHGLHEARNPMWMMCTIEGFEGKHPVKVPPRFRGKLTKKRFPIEKIQDASGITWRHEWYRQLEAYGR